MAGSEVSDCCLLTDHNDPFELNSFILSQDGKCDRALALLMEEERQVKAMKPLKGALKGDRREWPYH